MLAAPPHDRFEPIAVIQRYKMRSGELHADLTVSAAEMFPVYFAKDEHLGNLAMELGKKFTQGPNE